MGLLNVTWVVYLKEGSRMSGGGGKSSDVIDNQMNIQVHMRN